MGYYSSKTAMVSMLLERAESDVEGEEWSTEERRGDKRRGEERRLNIKDVNQKRVRQSKLYLLFLVLSKCRQCSISITIVLI